MQNNYYVYVHRLIKNNEVFYVGKGTSKRCNIKSGRSIAWNNITKENAWYSQILKSNMTEEESEWFEEKIIQVYKTKLCNIRYKRNRKIKFTLDECKSIFEISDTSPSYLIWKQNRKPAGWSTTRKGWLVQYGDRTIGVHRIVFLLHNGYLDFSKPIDHIDGNNFNNHPSNLQNVSISVNNKNRLLSDEPLITFQNGKESKGWLLKYSINGVRTSHYFSILKYGSSENAKMACIDLKNSLRDFLISNDYPERIFN